MFGIRFGSVQSAPEASAGFRYLRFQFDSAATSSFFSNDSVVPDNRFGFMTDSGLLPSTTQTSATNPLLVTESSKYGGSDNNAGWRLFSSQFTAWTPEPADPAPWVTVDFGSILTNEVTGVRTISNPGLPNAFSVYSSLTGEFSGEETLIGSKSGFTWNEVLTVQEVTF